MMLLLLASLFLPLLTIGQSCIPPLTICTCSEGRGQISCNGYNISVVKDAILTNNLGDNLVSLLIYSSQETMLPENFLIEFPNLAHLILRYGALNTITPGAFTNATNLQTIDLRNNMLTWLSGPMFAGVTSSLVRIQLDNNDIVYLLSDLDSIFSLVSTQITLVGNNLVCSCQLQWLTDLLNSNTNHPDINGAVCTNSNGDPISLQLTGLNFTNCSDLCSLGYYDCPDDFTCTPTGQNQSYQCLENFSPSLSMTLSPSIQYSLSPSPSLQSLLSSASFVITSLYDVSSTSYTAEMESLTSSQFSSGHSFMIETTSTVASTFMTTVTPTATPAPAVCLTPSCRADQNCVQFNCGCSECLCTPPLVQSNNSCMNLGSGYCNSEQNFGLMWPVAAIGTTVSLPCCSLDASHCESATRSCQSNGQWSTVTGPQCVSPGTHSLQSLLAVAAMSGSPVHLHTLSAHISDMSQSNSLLPGDLTFLSNLIAQTINLVGNTTNISAIQNMVESVNHLLSDFHVDTWQQTDSSSMSIASLYSAIETLGTNLPLENDTLVIAFDNLALIVLKPSEDDQGWNISSNLLRNYTGGESSIFLPASIFRDLLGDKNLTDCDVRVIVSLWDVDSDLLRVNDTGTNDVTQAPLVHGQCDWGSTEDSSSRTYMVNSIIITASVHSSNCLLNETAEFVEPVLIILYHVNASLNDPTCSFLDPTDNSGSSYRMEGCQVDTVRSTDDYTVCSCSHLTSFALLMSPTGASTTNQPLLIATKVGLCISITALIITVILLFSLKIESKLNQVHRQLALSLCLSQMLFLVGVDRTAVPSPDALCTFIAALLHYLLLCTFAWQLVEGIHLYLFIVKVFYNTKVVWAYYPLAWGVPLIIVGITMGVDFCDYGSLHYCWITNAHGALWSFHIPVIVVIFFNLVVLVAVSVVVARASRKKDPNRCTLCSLLQASIILVPTLGLTWILGIFVVGTDLYSTVVEWIFFICTTLQGIAIFVIHCVINTEVRVAFLRAIGCHQAARKQRSVFELKPSNALSSIASSAEHWKRRMSSRRGSADQPSVTLPTLPNKEMTAYLMANALYRLDEESMEDSMFRHSTNTPKQEQHQRVTFADDKSDEKDEFGTVSDTESAKGDRLMQKLLQAEDINSPSYSFGVIESTSETESILDVDIFATDRVQSNTDHELTDTAAQTLDSDTASPQGDGNEISTVQDLESDDQRDHVKETSELCQDNTGSLQQHQLTVLADEIDIDSLKDQAANLISGESEQNNELDSVSTRSSQTQTAEFVLDKTDELEKLESEIGHTQDSSTNSLEQQVTEQPVPNEAETEFDSLHVTVEESEETKSDLDLPSTRHSLQEQATDKLDELEKLESVCGLEQVSTDSLNQEKSLLPVETDVLSKSEVNSTDSHENQTESWTAEDERMQNTSDLTNAESLLENTENFISNQVKELEKLENECDHYETDDNLKSEFDSTDSLQNQAEYFISEEHENKSNPVQTSAYSLRDQSLTNEDEVEELNKEYDTESFSKLLQSDDDEEDEDDDLTVTIVNTSINTSVIPDIWSEELKQTDI